MNRIKCAGKSHPNAGKKAVENCTETLSTPEPLAPGALYLCRGCAPQDSKNSGIHFQDHQFDKHMDGGPTPIGTEHIPFQGPRHRKFKKEEKPPEEVMGA